ncbi:MAG: HAMP domain-containing histidine kinase [Bacteroidales bacterium]|nr:HAMP domain-containing histidine kinase [Bacteroidales bacterium]
MRIIIGIIVGIAGWLCACAGHALPRDKQLLIINSYNEAGPWSKEMIRPVTMMIAKTEGISSTIVHLNGTLVKDSLMYQQMADGLFGRYDDDAPEYIVMVGNMAATLMPQIKERWGDIPMVLITKKEVVGPIDYYFTGPVDQSRPNQMVPLERLQPEYNFTIIYVPDLYRETVDLMMQLQPNMRELVFLADEIYINRDLDHAIAQHVAERYPGVRYKWLHGTDQNSRKMRDYLVEETDTTGLLLSTWFYEKQGVHGYPMLVTGDFNMIPASTRPVFSLRNSYMEYGVIGGVYPDPEAIDNRICQVVGMITRGVPARKIPFYTRAEPVTMLSYPQLLESGIDQKLVPDDTVWVERPPSAWERYRWWIVSGLLMIILSTGGMMAYFWYQRSKINMLESSDRLKSAFLANMSHEIRTPLNAIVGFSNLMAKTEDRKKKEQFASIINDNNELLLQLVNDVLDLAKIESNTLDLNLKPTDINQLIDTVGETIGMRVPKGVAFNKVKGESDCVVVTDGNRVSQVLINLLTNACKFTAKGSITLSYEEEDGELLFQVRDTGIGMKPEDKDKLFRRFSKLNHFAQGNGLGLSISKSIADMLGGRIGVESRGPGKGSTFWFTIPNIRA